MISTFLSTLFGKLALTSAAVAVAATGAAAATGNLPEPAQSKVSEKLSGIGIEVPREKGAADAATVKESEASSETSAPVLPAESAEKAKAVTGTVFETEPGKELGEAVSGTARQAPELPEMNAAQKPETPAVPQNPGTGRRP